MIDERIQRLEKESKVVGGGPRELRQRADYVLELEIVGYFLEAFGDAAIRVQSVCQQHKGMTIERSRNRHSIRHLGKESLMGLFGNGTSFAMPTEIGNPHAMLATSRLDGCDILVTPTPELNMRKSSCSYTRDLLLGRKIGEQWVETNYRIHNTRLTSDESRAQAKCAFSRRFVRSQYDCSGIDVASLVR